MNLRMVGLLKILFLVVFISEVFTLPQAADEDESVTTIAPEITTSITTKGTSEQEDDSTTMKAMETTPMKASDTTTEGTKDIEDITESPKVDERKAESNTGEDKPDSKIEFLEDPLPPLALDNTVDEDNASNKNEPEERTTQTPKGMCFCPCNQLPGAFDNARGSPAGRPDISFPTFLTPNNPARGGQGFFGSIPGLARQPTVAAIQPPGNNIIPRMTPGNVFQNRFGFGNRPQFYQGRRHPFF